MRRLLGLFVAALPLAGESAAAGPPVLACYEAPTLGPWSGHDAPARPALYEIKLFPTERAAGAQGVAELRPAVSPFGVSLDVDGHPRFSVRLIVTGLPAPSDLGAYSGYVAWAATSDLSQVRRLGQLAPDSKPLGEVAWNKFLVFVTAESTPAPDHWSGPIVLKGVSPSNWLRRLTEHPLFSGGANPP